MAGTKKEKEYIELFQETGLNNNDALVFCKLIEVGSKGYVVQELLHELSLKRTTLYSILNKLIKLGYVKEEPESDRARKATVFTAINPTQYFDLLVSEKKAELDRLQSLKKKYSEPLESIYQHGVEYSLDELDALVRPYFEPLLNKGWKVVRYIVKDETLGFKLYDTALSSPSSRYLKVSGLSVLVFDFDTTKNQHALKFIQNGLVKETKEIYSIKFGKFRLVDDALEFFGKSYAAFSLRAKPEDLMRSDHLSNTLEFINNAEIVDSEGFIEVQKFVVVPIKEKLFYLWAESYEILKEMVESIFL